MPKTRGHVETLGHIRSAEVELNEAVYKLQDGEADVARHCLREAIADICRALGFDTVEEFLAEVRAS